MKTNKGTSDIAVVAVFIVIAVLLIGGSYLVSDMLCLVVIYALLYLLTLCSLRFCNIASITLSTITLIFWLISTIFPNNDELFNLHAVTYVCGLPLAFCMFIVVISSDSISGRRKRVGLILPVFVGIVLGWVARMGSYEGVVLYGMTLPLVGSIVFGKTLKAFHIRASKRADEANAKAKAAREEYEEEQRLDRLNAEESVRLYNERRQKLSVLNSKLSVISNSNPFNSLVVNEVDFNKTLTYLGNSIVNSDKVKWVKLSEKVSYLLNPETYYSNYIQELSNWSNFIHKNNDRLSKVLKSDYSNSPIFLNLVDNKTKYLIDNYKSAKLGIEGEELINNYLSQYDTITNLEDMNIVDNGGRESECDNVIVTPNGVFVLEVKNYGSQGVCRFDIDSTGLWKRNGSVLEKSPVEQNSRHLAVVNNILLANGFDIQAKGIIVIANRNAEVDNKSMDTVVRLDSLYSAITQGNRILSRENMNKISDIFNSNNREAKRFPVNCLEEELPIIKDLYDYMVQVRELIMSNKDAFGDDTSTWEDTVY